MTDSNGPARVACRCRRGRARAGGGFSLIEVVLVIVILGVIAAIAIPKLGRGSQGSADAALARDLQVLQKAIDLYAAEHNGAFPQPSLVDRQLTSYTDVSGTVSASNASPFRFGPYLRKVPAVPTGPNKGSSGIAGAPGIGVGWIYDGAEGTIAANTTPPPVNTPGNVSMSETEAASAASSEAQ